LSEWKEIVKLCHDAPKIYLRIGGNVVDDNALSELESLNNIHSLFLEKNKYSDIAMKHIGHLKNLEYLGVGGSPITDQGLSEIAGLSHLKVLRLSKAKISDKCVHDLAKLKSLEYLDISDTAFSASAVEELSKSLPKCRIRSGKE
jgi:internalin A